MNWSEVHERTGNMRGRLAEKRVKSASAAHHHLARAQNLCQLFAIAESFVQRAGECGEKPAQVAPVTPWQE
jgi:hypothetical protein